MILRGLHLENWRCIGKLTLSDLTDGIVILHGPNRTGKSSLVRAVRACLFEFDHNTTSKEFRKNQTWNCPHPPKMTIDFETGGNVYRITKVFSSRADGSAKLEKKIGSHWKLEEESPREASRKCRELLGTTQQSSSVGLNQLLWIDQGITTLPEQGQMDSTLEKRLMNVLGVLVTGKDLEFKQSLDSRWSRWFTPTGKTKEASPLLAKEREHQKRAQLLEEEEKKFREVEQVISDLERCEDALPTLRKSVEEAQGEVRLLQEERDRTRERREQYRRAEQEFHDCRRRLDEAESRKQQFDRLQQRTIECARTVSEMEGSVLKVEEEGKRARAALQQKTAALQSAEQAEETHLRGRGELDDRKTCASLLEQRKRLAQETQRARQFEAEMIRLEQLVRDIRTPDAKLLTELRRNRRRCDEILADLRAGALTITVTPQMGLQLQIKLDGQTEDHVSLHPPEVRTWQLRQRGILEIPGVWRVELARLQENKDLERLEQEKRELEQQYREVIRGYQEDPADETALDRLQERRFRRDEGLERLKQVRKELTECAPRGPGVLESDLAELDTTRDVLVRRRPELADQVLSPADLQALEKAFNSRAAILKKQHQEATTAEKQGRDALEKVTVRYQELREKLAGLRAAERAAGEELQRLGQADALEATVTQARAAVEQARQRLAETALTDVEQGIDRRLQQAETALAQRQDRVRQKEDERHRLRGRLEGSEGLHIRRADAEMALCEIEELLAHEKLEADAHQRLRELFDSCRESQVERVLGPIGDRVLEWGRYLGLNDYREFRFGDDFLPDGFVLRHGETETPVAMHEESYGTDEQLSLLVRLALGGVLAQEEPAIAIFDDPLAHADPVKHRRILDILQRAAEGNASTQPPAGRMQIIILTCHPDRFDFLAGAKHIDLAKEIVRA